MLWVHCIGKHHFIIQGTMCDGCGKPVEARYYEKPFCHKCGERQVSRRIKEISLTRLNCGLLEDKLNYLVG